MTPVAVFFFRKVLEMEHHLRESQIIVKRMVEERDQQVFSSLDVDWGYSAAQRSNCTMRESMNHSKPAGARSSMRAALAEY